jgi:hypothetical protein
MHQVSKILLCHETLHVSSIICAHHQELSAVHVANDMCHAAYVAAASLANGVGSQCSSHCLGTWCIQHYYRRCAHLGCQ